MKFGGYGYEGGLGPWSGIWKGERNVIEVEVFKNNFDFFSLFFSVINTTLSDFIYNGVHM
jgi:hypothetical protein